MAEREIDFGARAAEISTRLRGNTPEFDAAAEEQARFEEDRKHTLRVGFEEWENLSSNDRKALVREKLSDAFSDIAGVATSPRKLGINQGVKGILSRVAPGMAKKLFARGGSQRTQGLMQRIKKVRTDRARNREAAQATARQRMDRLDRQFRERRARQSPARNRAEQRQREIGVIRIQKELASKKLAQPAREKLENELAENVLFLTNPLVQSARFAIREAQLPQKLADTEERNKLLREMNRRANAARGITIAEDEE